MAEQVGKAFLVVVVVYALIVLGLLIVHLLTRNIRKDQSGVISKAEVENSIEKIV